MYSHDRQLGQRLFFLIEQSNPGNPLLKVSYDWEKILLDSSITILLLGICENSTDCSPSDSEDVTFYYDHFPSFREHHPHTQLILLADPSRSANGICKLVNFGVNAIIDFSRTDFTTQLRTTLSAASEHYNHLSARQIEFNAPLDSSPAGIIGVSQALRQVLRQSTRAARISDAPVIIFGESGTGKQRIAEFIHQQDEKRSKNAFISVNCSAITGSLAESELFGHMKGAFTGATKDRQGYFRAADGGTILLDEISELSLSLQPKILRVLQEGKILPVGSDREYEVDVRVIAATNRNLEEMIANHQFRLDLYQRLNVIHLSVPPLRERLEDIPLLFEAFLHKYRHYYPEEITAVDPAIYDIIQRGIGPGNVRELENLVRQILVFKEGGQTIEQRDLPSWLHRSRPDASPHESSLTVPEQTIEALLHGTLGLSEAVEQCERHMLRRLLDRRIRPSDLASRLGITRRTLYNKLQKYNLR